MSSQVELQTSESELLMAGAKPLALPIILSLVTVLTDSEELPNVRVGKEHYFAKDVYDGVMSALGAIAEGNDATDDDATAEYHESLMIAAVPKLKEAIDAIAEGIKGLHKEMSNAN